MKRLKEFEKKMDKVSELYSELKNQELSLDDHLKKFKEAKKMIAACRSFLEEAEIEVNQIISEDGEERIEPFE